jgi:hypothetical protein
MMKTIHIEMIAAQVACEQGLKDSWRATAEFAAGQLRSRYGDKVSLKYYDLFDVDCPPIPPGSQLPLILVDGEILSSGGKISVPLIRKRIDELDGGF